ncbi:prepilin-type N-terminal cleavage/methylation domain-containing protein [Sedimenticola hydrogenitrophicus]|uniref:prepilin-type N-terminal cleavage/methylation domain-containing protein n=1 Tax=Sedimenticola hydrogenitrophicus TaxID=2967975 RepID=UPI0021A55C59
MSESGRAGVQAYSRRRAWPDSGTWVHCQRGVTLIELVVSIVILSVAAAGIMMVMTRTVLSSADPMLREQATAIAQSYMEEILTQPLTDPDGGEVNGPEGGETRATYDDVWDYHGIANSAGALDQNGGSVAGLEGYNIAVAVSTANLGPGAGSPAVRIAITVTHDGQAGINVPVVAYRLN